MIEPEPKEIDASALCRRVIRVGLVLSEDRLSELKLHVGGNELLLNQGDFLGQDSKLTVSCVGDKVELRNEAGELLISEEKILIAEKKEAFPVASLQIDPIIAGRSFHWKKKIKADFPGNFEFSAREGFLQVVNILPFENYLACVVVSEMSSGAPVEFVKAQSITARSWALCFLNEKHPHEDFELCNDDDCQRYHGVTFADELSLKATLETAGEYLVTEAGLVLAAYYSKSCGGVSENPEDCFGFKVPGLRAVKDGESEFDPKDIDSWVALKEENAPALYCAGPKERLEELLGGVDDIGDYFRWIYKVTGLEIASFLRGKANIPNAQKVTELIPLKRGASGRIHELEILYETETGSFEKYLSKSQYEIRSLLHESFLFSSAFTISHSGDEFTLKGAGWGHGVGLCQIGGTFQALQGRAYRDILGLYFPDAKVKKCY